MLGGIRQLRGSHVDINVGGEAFEQQVLILERNYLDIYGPGPPEGPRLTPTYDNWGSSTLPNYVVGEQFGATLNFHEGSRDHQTISVK